MRHCDLGEYPPICTVRIPPWMGPLTVVHRAQFIWLKNIERLHDTDMFARTIVSPFTVVLSLPLELNGRGAGVVGRQRLHGHRRSFFVRLRWTCGSP